VAIGQPYPKHEERATAIHEAGHAVCSHVYMENLLSTRLSIRKRGRSGGHHQAMAIEDRFGSWRSEEFGELMWVLGAMSAEIVFYGQNTNGVGGDLGMATNQAAYMVGASGKAPAPIDLSDRIADPEARKKAEKEVMERFEELGMKVLSRAAMGEGTFAGTALGDPVKRKLAAGLLGQAFVIAYETIKLNKDATEHIAERLIAEGEMYGDDVTQMLDDARLRKPEIDVLDESAWPVI
jgi:hypothetical protein